MFKRFRVNDNTNYTKVSNQFLRDKKLSLKAKGLMLVVMSLPDDWDFSISGLVTIVKESKNAIYGTIDELKEKGYCKTEIIRNNGKFVDTKYIFYESANCDKTSLVEKSQIEHKQEETCISNAKPGQFINVPISLVAEKKITGNELLVYSLILGFNRSTGKEFRGSMRYIQECTGITRESVCHILKKLVEKGYLKKRETYVNKVKYCLYTAIQNDTKEDKTAEDADTESDSAINGYIKLFLIPEKTWGDSVSLEEKMRELRLDDCPIKNSQEIWSKIADYIKGMNYKEFLQTRYWKAISDDVKKRAGYKCAMCNSEERLEVHHKTYEHHGEELNHPEDLICLCHNCHAKFHNK